MAAAVSLPVGVFAASSDITISSDKTIVEPGDIVEFEIVLGPVSDLGTMDMTLSIPDGLSYVEGSGAYADGLKQALGFDYLEFVESNLRLWGVASKADYESDSATTVFRFSCTVEDSFSGSAELGLTKLEFGSCETWKNLTDNYSVSGAVISSASSGQPSGGNDPSPGGNTDPATPGGNTDPVTPGGNTDPSNPGGNTDPVAPGDNTDPVTPGGNTDPVPGKDDTPAAPGEGGEPSQDGQPTEDPSKQDGEQTVDPSGQDSTPSGQDADPGKNNDKIDKDTDKNTNGKSGENSASNGSGDKDADGQSKQGSEDKTEPSGDDGSSQTQKGFPFWTIPAAAVVIALICIALFRRKKH
jgi:hypothetical protein